MCKCSIDSKSWFEKKQTSCPAPVYKQNKWVYEDTENEEKIDSLKKFLLCPLRYYTMRFCVIENYYLCKMIIIEQNYICLETIFSDTELYDFSDLIDKHHHNYRYTFMRNMVMLQNLTACEIDKKLEVIDKLTYEGKELRQNIQKLGDQLVDTVKQSQDRINETHIMRNYMTDLIKKTEEHLSSVSF